MTFLKQRCMHKSCSSDKAVDLSTICCRIKCFIFSAKFILSCRNSLAKIPCVKEIREGSHRKIPCFEEIKGLVLPCDKFKSSFFIDQVLAKIKSMFLIWSNVIFKTIFLFSSIYIKGIKIKLSTFLIAC